MVSDSFPCRPKALDRDSSSFAPAVRSSHLALPGLPFSVPALESELPKRPQPTGPPMASAREHNLGNSVSGKGAEYARDLLVREPSASVASLRFCRARRPGVVGPGRSARCEVRSTEWQVGGAKCKGRRIGGKRTGRGWRRGWDSNPRYGYPYTRFPSVLLKPLGHLSTSHCRRRSSHFAPRTSDFSRFPVASLRLIAGRPGYEASSTRPWDTEEVGFEPTCLALHQTTRFRVGPVTTTSVLLRTRVKA